MSGRKDSFRKVRVLFVNTRSALGADVAVHLTLIQNFDPEQVEVHIATNKNSSDLEKTLAILRPVPNLKITVCDLGHESSGGSKADKIRSLVKNSGAALSLLNLAFYIRRNKIDVLHATDRPRDALFSTLLAKMTGRKNVIHCHIKWYPSIGRAITWGLNACAKILAISYFTRDSLIEGGIPAEKIVTIHNATDAVLFDPAKTQCGALRGQMGIAEDIPLVGIVARCLIFKGQMELVEAFALVLKAVPNAKLAIIGMEDNLDNPNADSYAKQVRKRAEELGISGAIFWAGWHDAIAEIMADLDVQAIPSWEEPFGLVVTEGLAMERAIVGYNTGALPEIIADGAEGLLVPPKDAAVLAEKIVELLQDRAKREQMGRAGRARVLKDFSPQRQAEQAAQMYRDMLQK